MKTQDKTKIPFYNSFMVIYCAYPFMRERYFKDKTEAELFCKKQKGSLIEIKNGKVL